MNNVIEYQAPALSASDVQEQHEPTVQESADMIQRAFGKVLDKALRHADLTKRVEDLEETVRHLERELYELRSALSAEKAQHEETRNQLSAVQYTLGQRETTIHDLVQERDIVLGERNDAQSQRDTARYEAASWQEKYAEAQRIIEAANARYSALEAEHKELQAKMDAFRAAFRGLAA